MLLRPIKLCLPPVIRLPAHPFRLGYEIRVVAFQLVDKDAVAQHQDAVNRLWCALGAIGHAAIAVANVEASAAQ